MQNLLSASPFCSSLCAYSNLLLKDGACLFLLHEEN